MAKLQQVEDSKISGGACGHASSAEYTGAELTEC